MRFIYFVGFGLFLFSCHKGNDCFNNKGEDSSQVRTLAKFSKIDVSDNLHLVLVQDSAKAGQVTLSGPQNLLDQITTDISDEVLILRNINKCNFVRSFDYEIDVTVYIDKISNLTIDGVAKVSTIDTLFLDNLRVFHFALSDARLIVHCNEFYIRSDNSAHTQVAGRARVLKGSIEEISDLNAEELATEETIIDTHTPLNCYVNATKGLYIKIYGGGNVYYLGEPQDYKVVALQQGKGQLLKK